MSHKKDGSGDQVFVKGNGVFRQGAVHLMLYALDPLGKGPCKHNNNQLERLGSLESQLDPDPDSTKSNNDSQATNTLQTLSQNMTPKLSEASMFTLPGTPMPEQDEVNSMLSPRSVFRYNIEKQESSQSSVTHSHSNVTTESGLLGPLSVQRESSIPCDTKATGVNVPKVIVERPPSECQSVSAWSKASSLSMELNQGDKIGQKEEDLEGGDKGDGAEEEPLDISWPKTWRRRVTYLLLIPIVWLLYFTLPDVRHEVRRPEIGWLWQEICLRFVCSTKGNSFRGHFLVVCCGLRLSLISWCGGQIKWVKLLGYLQR
jgi:hypothetical protein